MANEDIPGPPMNDVTVRLPIDWEPAEAAGFIERAVTDAFREAGYHGSAFVMFRVLQGTPRLAAFLDGAGMYDPYIGEMPHGLVEKEVADGAEGS